MQTRRLARPRLNDRLRIAAEYPVTAVIAPAGFGKSVALRDFLATERIEHVRFDVRAENATLFEFVRGFAIALHAYAPGALASYSIAQERAMVANDPSTDLAAWMTQYLQSSTTLVVEDIHFADHDPRTAAFLRAVIEQSWDRVRWIVTSRSAIPLPFASWLAYDRMDNPVTEADLQFTAQEAVIAAESAAIDEETANQLFELTHGWPVAFSIALRGPESLQIAKLGQATREIVYRYLAEQVFSRLDEARQRFLLETAVFPTLDGATIEARGDSPDLLASLRNEAGFIYASAENEYRYHDLFRDFLLSQLRAQGETIYRKAVCEAAAILCLLERWAPALSLYVSAEAFDEAIAILEQRGFELLDLGRSDVLEGALQALERLRTEHPILIGLEATLSARRGHHDVAEGLFRTATRLSSPRWKAILTYRFAIHLVRRRNPEAITLLEPYVDDASLEVGLRASILGTAATAHVYSGNNGTARNHIERALTLLEQSKDTILRARIYQQAAFVMEAIGQVQRARQYAQNAVEIAAPRSLFDIAARAYSVLYNIASDRDDDPISSLKYLELLDQNARRGGNRQTQLFALMCIFDIQAERGDAAALDDLEPQLHDAQDIFPELADRTLIPGRALRLAWDKNFRAAYELLEPAACRQDSSDRRALRLAESAVYGLAGSAEQDATSALEQARDILTVSNENTRRLQRARLLVVMCDLLRGHDTSAHRLLSHVEKTLDPMSRLRYLAKALRAIYSQLFSDTGARDVEGALERLRVEQFGGLSRLLEVLPFPSVQSAGLSTLTSAERIILRALAEGASSKTIALQSGRSPQTVDVHIRSICRKLGCSGRREAVAMALAAGWLT